MSAPPGPLLVLAGAGSGKTRVLTHRMAWLVQVEQVSPLSILAVTFTNKAANEMRGRIEKMLGFPMRGMWIGTFHSIAHRLLRMHWQEAGLPQAFQVLDSEDQLRVIRRILKELNLDDAYYQPKQVQWFISAHKEEGRRPEDLPEGYDTQRRELTRIYRAYEENCRKLGLVDFSELLLRVLELLRNNAVLLERYRGRFQHVLVDEFQDTNAIQYEWIKLLAGEHRRLFIVGDEDQSVYGWRGARVENILGFERDFPGTRVVRLEQNYRSTSSILNAANAVISRNRGRLGKKLWTDGAQGEPVRLYTAYNDLDEARFVVDRIRRWTEAGRPRRECAILYRSNAQSRVFEQLLMEARLPYRVYGGLRFFERAEIKDALAYLRLMSSRRDDPSFERVVNQPARGIGNRTLEQLREHARAASLTLWEATLDLLARKELSARAASALAGFCETIERLAEETRSLPLAEQVQAMLDKSGLIAHYKQEKGEKGESRVENLEELVNAAGEYAYEELEGLDPLTAFLSYAALESGEGQANEWEDSVQLMSLHSAKGLEFPLVFLTGLEEGLFPHERSITEPGRLEEERRLCYVGMTRAMQELYLSHAEVRRWHGRETYTRPSRFLAEIPPELLRDVRGGTAATQPAPARAPAPAKAGETKDGLRLGAYVRHKTFGEGVVVHLEGRGEHARVQVQFETGGAKWLVAAVANLQVL